MGLITGGVEDCDNCGEVNPIDGRWTPTRESPFGKWTCENCRRAADEPGPYSEKLLQLYLLKKAGYPFEKDDLDPEDWTLLGMMEAMLNKALDPV